MSKKFLFSLAVFLAVAAGMAAQELPYDPELRKGVLDNGMTYYIRHNAKPEGQAEFWIVHNVGAVQEEDSQQGLAHFLEHMAFNGTEHFPDEQLSEWCEGIGVKFGNDLNAFTTREYTCYNISNVPLVRESVVDSCLLILHDWSHYIALEGDEIDRERGVIIEELRRGEGAGTRLWRRSAPLLYGDTRYATRNLIGYIDGLNGFSHSELRDFYNRWYRPDLQAVIIVGDFDVDAMEAKVREVMSGIPAREHPESKQRITLPENTEPLVGLFTDPEQLQTFFNLYYKRAAVPFRDRSTRQGYRLALCDGMMMYALNLRLAELAMRPDASFVSAFIAGDPLASFAADVLCLSANVREGELLRAFTELYTEMERVSRYGFTEAEFEAVKANFEGTVQRTFDSRNDRYSSELARGYRDNFLYNEPVMDARTRYETDMAIIGEITAEELNDYAKRQFADENQVLIAYAPEDAPGLPTVEELEEAMVRVRGAVLEENPEGAVVVPLMPEDVRLKGARVKKTEEGVFGSTVWTLRNGVRVVVKPTDFMADQVCLYANMPGGLALLADEELLAVKMLESYLPQAGVADLDAALLRRQLAGKSVSYRVATGFYTTGFSGMTSPKDLETLFQLVYLFLTRPRFDEGTFGVVMEQLREYYRNRADDPSFRYEQEVQETLYGNSPRRPYCTYDDIDGITLEQLQHVYHKLYGNSGQFTFYITGNVDEETLRPMVEKYLGSLPRAAHRAVWVDDGVRIPSGKVENRFAVKMEQPKVSVCTVFTGRMPYTLENRLAMTMLGQLLEIRYTAVMREEKGGTYSVGVSGTVQHYPVQQYRLSVMYETAPEKLDMLRPDVTAELARIAREGADEADLAKVKEYLAKFGPERFRSNWYWLSVLDDYYLNGNDSMTGYMEVIDGFTSDDFRELAVRILTDGNMVEVIMEPEPEVPAE